MQVGDTVITNYKPKKGPAISCRATILEINNAVARISTWTGKEFVTQTVMLRDLRKPTNQK